MTKTAAKSREKKIQEKSIGNFGWRSYRIIVDPAIAADRLARCPLISLREKMTIDLAAPHNPVEYTAGLGGDETECARWILVNHVPDESKLTEQNREEIFAWVRATA